MPKRLFRKYLPSPEKIRRNRSLSFLGHMLADPNLWHINRHSLGSAAFVGIFCALLPIPMQMAVAGILALRFKANLPLSLLLVWFTNPFTYVPVFYFTYRVGAWMVGVPHGTPDQVTIEWLSEQYFVMLLGSLACGLVFGLLGLGLVKATWRMSVKRNWQRRRQQRLGRNASSDNPS